MSDTEPLLSNHSSDNEHLNQSSEDSDSTSFEERRRVIPYDPDDGGSTSSGTDDSDTSSSEGSFDFDNPGETLPLRTDLDVIDDDEQVALLDFDENGGAAPMYSTAFLVKAMRRIRERQLSEKWPRFLTFTTILSIVLFLAALYDSGGFVPFEENQTVGASPSSVLKFGGSNGEAITRQHQWYRLFTTMFVPAGILHLMGNSLFLLTAASDIEVSMGAVRFAACIVLSSFSGALVSALFLPTTVLAGASLPLFAVIGIISTDVLASASGGCWYLTTQALLLVVTIVVCLGVGLLPIMDNFAHLFALYGGICTCLMFNPAPAPEKGSRCASRLRVLIGATLFYAPLLPALVALWYGAKMHSVCRGCYVLNCIDFFYHWCYIDAADILL